MYDMKSGSDEVLMVFKGHVTPVTAMRYNVALETVISADEKGEIDVAWFLAKILAWGVILKCS